jgi:myosin heavy subunit
VGLELMSGKLKGITYFRPIGVMSLLDEEAKLPSSSDKTLTAKLNSNLQHFNTFEKAMSGDDLEFKVSRILLPFF